MSEQRIVYIICDAVVGSDICAEEGPQALTLTEAKRLARVEGWQTGHNRAAYDRCPKHRNANCSPWAVPVVDAEGPK